MLPAGKEIAEFLQEVTLPAGIEKYRVPDISPRVMINLPEDFGPDQGLHWKGDQADLARAFCISVFLFVTELPLSSQREI